MLLQPAADVTSTSLCACGARAAADRGDKMEVVTRKRKWDGETERWLERGKGQGYGGGREEKAQWRTGTCLSMG